ncbi:uncharacterized protein LOC144381662 isoform X2 [Halichoerus grypus]
MKPDPHCQVESSSVSRGLFFISERWWASSFLAGGWKSKSKLSAGLVFPEASQEDLTGQLSEQQVFSSSASWIVNGEKCLVRRLKESWTPWNIENNGSSKSHLLTDFALLIV